MPHYKCAACKTRLHSAASWSDVVSDLCPECGSLLEPVEELDEIVGFRAIEPRPGTAEPGRPATHLRIAGPVDDFLSRRRAILLAQADVEAEVSWLDDGDSFRPEPVTPPPPETSS
jgi:Zn-finger nucleic acid-binding protein